MEVFKIHGNTYGVITSNYKQKQALFKLVGKRDTMATYYGSDGRKEQFKVTAKECDLINEKLRSE